MSILYPAKVKQLLYHKVPFKNNKSLDSSSKSTRATSKNILAIKNKKMIEKIEYYDLYSDLISSRQNIVKNIKKYNNIEDDETSTNSEISFDKFVFRKNKKLSTQKKSKINLIKYYKEDGYVVNFPLFKEKEINIDLYDKKVDIESGEDDFESDQGTIDYGKNKVNKDLITAFELIKKENSHCLGNLKKYSKLIDKDKKINLKKNLPIHK